MAEMTCAAPMGSGAGFSLFSSHLPINGNLMPVVVGKKRRNGRELLVITPRERTDTEIEAALQNGQRVLKINSMS